MCTTNMQYESKRIVARLDRMPLSAFHYKMLCVNGIAWAFDAFDVGIVTFVVAALTKEWGLNAGNIGILLSSGMAGMILGAFLSGPMADKFGRKAVFKWTLLLFSVFSLLCAITTDFWMLVICRFFVGIGLGGETPVVTSLLGEFIPAKDRGKVQGLLNCFWAIGWIAATAVSYYLIPTIGWRWAFVAGAVPAIYIWVIRLHLPESPRWLLVQGRQKEASAILDQMEMSVSQKTWLQSVSEADIKQVKDIESMPVKSLFASKYRKTTAMLWILWFMGMFGYYGLFAWMPTLLVQAGHSMVRSFEYVLFLQLAYIPNQVLSAYLMDKVGRKKLLVGNLFFSAISAVAFGIALGSQMSMTEVIGFGLLTSFFVSGIWGITYTYTPELYPTGIRATGTSWAATCSRFGSMSAPLVIGWSLAGLGVSGVYSIVAAAFVIAGFAVLALGSETKGKIL